MLLLKIPDEVKKSMRRFLLLMFLWIFGCWKEFSCMQMMILSFRSQHFFSIIVLARFILSCSQKQRNLHCTIWFQWWLISSCRLGKQIFPLRVSQAEQEEHWHFGLDQCKSRKSLSSLALFDSSSALFGSLGALLIAQRWLLVFSCQYGFEELSGPLNLS